MLLSKLEINGFKSFGDKIIINFDEGITGIVGPNGCGKSNIVDAIRWVLGEQKIKSLRSEKMQNVIFNGTKKRKPTQLAEVSLTFNNTKNLLPTEYSEVTVTRKFFRSGDGEYLLNGVHCRLKDITNLFLDTGIGPESYAIIELKMVDDILDDKDNSRRVLFEEAAGISKFKKRKKETLRKLEDTDADLERVDDLLYEIDKNLKSLKKQARLAQKYIGLKEEYKEKNVELAKITIGKHNYSYQKITSQIEIEKDKKVENSKKVKQKEAQIEKLKVELISKEKYLSEKQTGLNNYLNKISHYESDKQIKNERQKFLNDKSENLREQIEQDKSSKERAEFSLKSLKREKNQADAKLLEIKEKVSQLQEDCEDQKIRASQVQEEVNTFIKIHRNKQDEVFHQRKDIEIKEILIATLKNELEKTASDTTEKSANLVEFEKKIKKLDLELAKKSKIQQKYKSQESKLQQSIETTTNTIEVIKEELTQLNRKLDARQNEYSLTKSMVENLEGFPEAIKFLHKESGWGKNAPLLSDIISCHEDYRVTIENFLEPAMNYYVVDDETNAYKAINLLSDAAKGKANFFILSSFKDFNPSPAKIFDTALPASEIIEFDSKYKKLVSYILDNVYITTGDYTKIPKDQDCIFITKNGKITKKKYSISGGSIGLFEGKKIGRVKNLERLDKEIKGLHKKLSEVELSKMENEKELEKLLNDTNEYEIENLQLEINRINEEFISIKTKHEQFHELLSTTDHNRGDTMEKINQLSSEILKLKPKCKKENIALGELEKKLGLMNENLAAQNEMLSQKSSAYNQENIFYHQQANRVSSIDQEITFKQAAFDSSIERIEKNQKELFDNENEIKVLIQKSESSDDELIKMYGIKEEKEKEVNEAEKDYYKIRGDIDEKEKEERELQRSREAIDTIIMELQNKINDVKLELSSVKERLSVEFNIDIEELLSQTPEVSLAENEIDGLNDAVLKLKERLENMGPVNPMAMEAYDEIQERHEFSVSKRLCLYPPMSVLFCVLCYVLFFCVCLGCVIVCLYL